MVRVIGFSRPNREIYEDLHSKAEAVTIHLIKLFLWPYVQETGHWKKEVYAAISKISKLKSSNRRPKPEEIVKHTWGIVNDSIEDWTSALVRIMREDPVPYEPEAVSSAILEYFEWLADLLSSTGMVGSQEVSEEVEYLQNKYF